VVIQFLIHTWCISLATLILNWNEDGQIYAKRINEKDLSPPMELNPWIRAFRLSFVVLFAVVDIGMALYNVSVSLNFLNFLS
jgi:hypothetical protein